MSAYAYSGSPLPTEPCTGCCGGEGAEALTSNSRPVPITTQHSVVLSSGRFIFSLPLLSLPSLGGIGWSFALNYLSGMGNVGIAGAGFNSSNDLRLAQAVGGVELLSGSNTRERFNETSPGVFAPAAENNTRAMLTVSGSGSTQEFTLTSSAGVVTKFFGFHTSFAAPGMVKSITDRYGSQQAYTWQVVGETAQLASVTDSYGRSVAYRYFGSEKSYRLREIEDSLGRKLNFQYDDAGRLVAVVTPSILRAAEGNTFPGGTAYAFQYDSENPRPERRDDLIRIWYPNQTLPFIDVASRTVDVEQVYQDATPRYFVEYGQDPTDEDLWGRVIRETVGDPASGVGGTYNYVYTTNIADLPVNIIDPDDVVVFRCLLTDPNGNQSTYDFNARQMAVRVEKFKTRNKNSLEASSCVSWTKYNINNQPLLEIMPEGNSVEYEYEAGEVAGIGNYPKRKGLLLRRTRKTGNPIATSNPNFPYDPTNPAYLVAAPRSAASNGQTELTSRIFYDPVFNQPFVTIEERGNPIASGSTYFTPQNDGTTPDDNNRSRYATFNYFDYQKNDTETILEAMSAQLGLDETECGALLDFVNDQLLAGGIPSGHERDLGDINGDYTGNGNDSGLEPAPMLGNVVKTKHPAVRLIGATEITTQVREELFTHNAKGQITTHVDPEGNLRLYVRYPYSDPEGNGSEVAPGLGNKQYGYLKEVHVDAVFDHVMSLIGSDGDLVNFISGKITRTNTPTAYQDLVTRYEGSGTNGGCSSCAYDALGNPLAMTDPRGFTTQYHRNEMGELFRTVAPSPYFFKVETHYDANRNVTRVDTEDKVVQYTSDDPSSADYGHFVPSGSGSTAHVPMKPGAGGTIRPGWFTNLTGYDLLDRRIEEDVDATGSNPASLVMRYEYDPNGNLVKLTKPEGNTVEYDYNERNLRIAERIGCDGDQEVTGSVTVVVYDKNGNLLERVGPAARGGSGNHRTVTVQDAFRSTLPLVHTGDWLSEYTIDGFDRVISAKDSVGNVVDTKYDPGSRAIETVRKGPTGGATPTNRSGSGNADLAKSIARFDEAGRHYEAQQDVFLVEGNLLPSDADIYHVGGGLATNSVANDHTGSVELSDGGSSYLLTRSVYDRAGRMVERIDDNTNRTAFSYDGVGRLCVEMENNTDNDFDDEGGTVYMHDGNGNVIKTIKVEKSFVSYNSERFRSTNRYDSLNRLVVAASQGADGNLSSDLDDTETIFSFSGYDSRGNQTLAIDPKQNSIVQVFDGASRLLRVDQHLRPNGIGSNAPEANTTFLPNGGASISTRTFYDANSRIVQLVDDRGGVTSFAYDTLDRQTTLMFHDGSMRESMFNEAGDVTSYTDENGSVFNNTFDALGRKTGVAISLASGVIGTTAQSFQYDGLSRVTFARDSIGSTHADVDMRYDSLSRVVEDDQTFQGNSRYVVTTEHKSLMPSVLQYPNERQVRSVYDGLNRRTLVEEAGSGDDIASWNYVGLNRVGEIALANGLIGTWLNNARTRSTVTAGQASPSWDDQDSDRLGYDGAGRAITKRYLAGGINGSTHAYNDPTAIVGFTTAYDKSSNKLYERALHAESRSSLYRYIPSSGGPWFDPHDPVWEEGHDSLNRLRRVTRGVLADGGGSVTSSIQVDNALAQGRYALDGLGNWMRVELGTYNEGVTQFRQHNHLNQITRTDETYAPNVAFSYDGVEGASNGNLTSDGVRVYEWDALNRLKKVYKTPSSPVLIAEYAYDAFGRRIRKVVSNGGLSGTTANGTTDYIYNSKWQCVEERNGSNEPTKQYVWGSYIDELIQQKHLVTINGKAAGEYYPLQDLLYRTVALTDSEGVFVEVYDYDPYGNTVIFNAAGTGSSWWAYDATQTKVATCEALFTGQRYDAESEMYHYRARQYVPGLGRFVSRDPLLRELGGSENDSKDSLQSFVDGGVLTRGRERRLTITFDINLYRYVRSMPLMATDPTGLDIVEQWCRNACLANYGTNGTNPDLTNMAGCWGICVAMRNAAQKLGLTPCEILRKLYWGKIKEPGVCSLSQTKVYVLAIWNVLCSGEGPI